uniref:Brinker DNA-binding domain-containing protein n=1 Tax=Amphimedon queenslandica TaxID=400682 RepID=A0A1X7TVA6_AMPQE
MLHDPAYVKDDAMFFKGKDGTRRGHCIAIVGIKNENKDDTSDEAEDESFDAAFKLNVVEEAKKTSNRAAARKFSIDEAIVRYWRKQKDKLQSTPRKKKRLPGAGRKALR